jgi:uncharacterized protein YkwD
MKREAMPRRYSLVAAALAAGSLFSSCFGPGCRLPALGPPDDEPGPLRPDPSASDVVSRLTFLHNDARRAAGLDYLAVDDRLVIIAQDHARWMADRRTLRHQSLRVIPFGFRGENIAAGQPDAESVTRAWMRSPGHRRNILHTEYIYFGFGHATTARGVPYWCAVFGG